MDDSIPPAGAIRFVEVPLDSMWVRDYGPIFVRRADGSAAVADCRYIMDGSLKPRPNDDRAPRVLAGLLGLPVAQVPLRLEGGNLLSNGEGICVTTSSVISENRRQGLEPEDVGKLLARHFGVRRWVNMQALPGEKAGHVDMFVTFLAPDLAVVGRCDPLANPCSARVLDDSAKKLAGLATSRGPMKVHRIPMPPKLNGLWRSHTNIILANGVVLVPTFKDVDASIQQEALDLYERLLPDWKVVAIPADTLAKKWGLLHCASLNVPAFVDLNGIARSAAPLGPAVSARAAAR